MLKNVSHGKRLNYQKIVAFVTALKFSIQEQIVGGSQGRHTTLALPDFVNESQLQGHDVNGVTAS